MNIRELGRTPVSDASRTGDDIRYDPLFDALQAEIDAKPSAGSGGTNWNKVVEVASGILEKKSKDILVASYLAVGLLRTGGVPSGLLDGIILLKDMIDCFWEGMFPPIKRMRGRAQAIGWWIERTEDYINNVTDVSMIPADTLEELTVSVEALYDLISDKCPEAPSLRRILEFVRSLPTDVEETPESVEEPQPPPPVTLSTEQARQPEKIRQQPQQPQQTAPQPQSDSPFQQTGLNNQEDANRLLSSLIEKNYLLVDFMLALPTPEPSWYHLNLLSAWFEIKKLPPATDNKTLIPPPDRQTGSSLAAMCSAGNWGGVVKSSCYTIRRYPFWLDMNRFAAEALGMMGDAFKTARLAVESDTARFTGRFTGIEKLTFSDGTPFADRETLNWFRNLEGAPASQQTETATASNSDELSARVADEFSRCRELIRSGKQGEGLTVMQNLLQSGRSGRERYLWRLSMVQLLTISGMEKLAVPHVTELMKDYDSFRLVEWDPDMALQALKTVWDVLRTQNDPESKRRADDTLARISMLSPSDAFNLMK